MSARGTDFCGDALVERNVTDGFSAQVVWPVSVAACDAVVEAREEGELSAEAFERFEGNARVIVVFNRSENVQTVRLTAPDGWPDASVNADFVSDGGSAVLRRVGGELLTEMPPLTGAVFIP